MGPKPFFSPHLFLFSILFEILAQLFFIKHVASPSRPLGSGSSVGGFSPGKDGYQKPPGLSLGLVGA